MVSESCDTIDYAFDAATSTIDMRLFTSSHCRPRHEVLEVNMVTIECPDHTDNSKYQPFRKFVASEKGRYWYDKQTGKNSFSKTTSLLWYSLWSQKSDRPWLPRSRATVAAWLNFIMTLFKFDRLSDGGITWCLILNTFLANKIGHPVCLSTGSKRRILLFN